MADEVLYEVRNQIVLITLNRPERLNAISLALREQLAEAFLRFEADPALRVAIVTGAGKKAFCAGMDLKEAAELKVGLRPRTPTLNDGIRVSKPVIAAVNGFALAGGWMIAQMCDLCVASEHAMFGITEGKVGRGMPWAAPMTRMMSQRVALELLLTGRKITAQRAYEIGFVNQVVPHDKLLEAATALARLFADAAATYAPDFMRPGDDESASASQGGPSDQVVADAVQLEVTSAAEPLLDQVTRCSLTPTR